MDFVEWCDLVLTTCFEVTRTSETARSIGVDELTLAEALSAKLGIADFRRQAEYYQSTYHTGMLNAIQGLQAASLIEENNRSSSFWKVSRLGRRHIANQTEQWFLICQEELDPEHAQLLSAINRLSPRVAPDHAWLEEVNQVEIASELGDWPASQIWNVANELTQWEFVSGSFFIGGAFHLAATYKGLVWETRRGFTLISKHVDELVAEWETTSVDFKRELHLDTADEKAEFIKDVLSLANTKASGKHWMIIGFDNRTHAYHGPPDQHIVQDRLEQILSVYTTPVVDIRYDVVDYREGPVGMLEVLRNPKKLPYSVAKSIGEKKRIEQGNIFVRHGSQVEKPTSLELQALQDEGNQTRFNP
jgi:hypothetical protein